MSVNVEQELNAFVREYGDAASDEGRRRIRAEYARLGYNKKELDRALTASQDAEGHVFRLGFCSECGSYVDCAAYCVDDLFHDSGHRTCPDCEHGQVDGEECVSCEGHGIVRAKEKS